MQESAGFRLDPNQLEDQISGGELVILGQPNNPTGLTFDPQALRALAHRHPETCFLIDEAFADFVEGLDSLAQNRPSNVIVLLSFTKFYAVPGLRLGSALLAPAWARKIQELRPSWTVNTLAQQFGAAALRDLEYEQAGRAFVKEQRHLLFRALTAIPYLTVYPGEANFLFLRSDHPALNAPELARRLLAEGIAIRVCDNYQGLDHRYFRVAVRTEAENQRLVDALKAVLVDKKIPRVKHRQTPALMFQGTSSNAGKSVLTAALCRILLQDGYRVAPFKSQNMSLNSFVTRDGGEMGRAQVVQAQACRLDPDVRMNPVLLKPSSDTGGQVIVRGRPVGNMDVNQYIAYKPQALARVKEAYDSLAGEFDVIVLEGAGSPAEVNLETPRHRQHAHGRIRRRAGPAGGRHRPGRRLCLLCRHHGSPGRMGTPAGGRVYRQPFPGRGEPAGTGFSVHGAPHRPAGPGDGPVFERPRSAGRRFGQLQERPMGPGARTGRRGGDRRDRSAPHLQFHGL